MSLKDVFRDALIIGMSGALLWHFSNGDSYLWYKQVHQWHKKRNLEKE